MRTLLRVFVVCVLFFSFAVFGQSAPSSLTGNPVYKKDCAKCHGKTATGRHFRGPSLVSEKTAAMSADDLRNMISNGKGRMPKFTGKLTPEEIDTLVQEIQGMNKK